MGKKGAMPSYKTVDDYINNQNEEARIILTELRHLIKEAVPEAREIPNYKVPSFTLIPETKPKQQLMIVAYAKYVSFYPYQRAVEHFSDELKNYELGKGTVKFQFNKPLPKDLIKRMVVFRKNELSNK
ncbi:iron chaperone [Winogradskyella sediminis]|uniref:iron chaperone n=1 Tax=Winogradskyella sediminis TaxID=1382466 RepID=UPI003AA8F6A4